MLAEGRY